MNQPSRSFPLLLLLAFGFLHVGCGDEGGIQGDKEERRLVFAENDVVCLVGNGLAERMQHDGCLEAMLQIENPRKKLSFYNLGFGADEITKQQRTSGFGSMDDYLNRCQASLVFAFFGFNESFAGKDGLDGFRRDLRTFVAKFRREERDDERKGRRLVLFSTSPFEDMGNPKLPDASIMNEGLSLYNEVIEEVAKDAGVLFVDIFTGLEKAFEESESHLTLNGIHLNRAGNRALAAIIVKNLGGGRKGAAKEGEWEEIRQAVVTKNEFWFQRYRATDGYNVYGGRSKLKFVDGVSNRDVLQEEMDYLDALVKRHTQHIWRVSQGLSSSVDKTGLPKISPVVTNIPGDNPDGSHKFKSGVAAMEDMTVCEGLEINLFASEEQFPELVNPVQMSWDSRGRLWVAVWPTYPHWQPGQPMNDKLIVLEDLDGDGKADKSTVFADHLHNPTGFEFWQGGVFAANAPDLLFLKDEDGDGVADVRKRVLHGLSSADTHHSANSFVFGPDGALYFQEGTFHQTQVETVYGPVRNSDGCVWRFEPRTWRVERHIPYNFANPHGHVFDRWGQEFVTDGTGNQNYYALPFSGYLPGKKKHRGYGMFFQQRCRPAAATEILSSQSLGSEFEGDYVIANVIGFRGILRYQIEDRNSGFGAREVEAMVQSRDENFRPSDLEVGPDGALYFLDWHNPIIGHMQHHLRDPSRDVTHGRVYRISSKTGKRNLPLSIHGKSIDELVALLTHDENRVRYRVRAELSAHSAADVLKVAKERISTSESEHFLLEMLWLHQQFDEVDNALLDRLLSAKDFRARAAATRVVGGMRHKVKDPLEKLGRMVNDKHPRVRLEAVVAASFFPSAEAASVALEVVDHPMDRFLTYALGETLRALESFWRQAVKAGDLVAKKPAGQDFLLKQIDRRDLSLLPQVPAVWRALLTRANVGLSERVSVMSSLAQETHSSPVGVVCDAILKVDGQDSPHKQHIMADLGVLLQNVLYSEDQGTLAQLEGLRDQALSSPARRIALAALATWTGDLRKDFEAARSSTKSLESFLKMIPLIQNDDLRASGFALIRPLIFSAGAVSLREKAMELQGIQVTYYESTPKSAKIEVIAELSPQGAGRVSEISLNIPVIKRPNKFSLVFRGKIKIAVAGDYKFFTVSDDGSCLYIDGQLVVNNDGAHGPQEQSGTISLTEGLHDIVVTFYELGGGKALRVLWTPPGARSQIPLPDSVLVTDSGAELSSAAILAIASMPDCQQQKFRDAARLYGAGRHIPGALALLEGVDQSQWPRSELRNVIDSIAGYASTLTAEERTTPTTLASLSLAKKLALKLGGEEAKTAIEVLEGLSGTVVLLRTLPHQMLYDRREIWVQTGKPLAIVFQNNDVMPHNLVVIKPGKMQSVGEAAERLPAGEVDFIPKTDDVLWHTALLKPGDSTRLTFVAPEQPGDLPFVCTFPGHWRVMNGIIHVVESMEGHSNQLLDLPEGEDSAARDFVRMWKTEDFKGAFVQGWDHGRSIPQGKKMFHEGGCIKCHQSQGQGDKQLLDLSAIGKKYDAATLLEQIIQPSSTILEGYENHLFEVKGRQRVVGRIRAEDDRSVLVATELQDPSKVVALEKNDIKFRKKLKLSPMPTGLLVTLSRDEILDLLHFLMQGNR